MATVSILKKQRTISRKLFSLSYNSCIEKLSKGDVHEIRVYLTILNDKAKQMFDIEEEFKNAIFNLDLTEEETLKELDLESFLQRETDYILLKARCEKLLRTESDEIPEFGTARFTSNNKSLDAGHQPTENYKDCGNSLKEYLHDDIIEQVEGDDNSYFLAQHSIIKEASLTTRMGPVFDTSARDAYGKYLNASSKPSINLMEMIPKLLHDCRIREYGVTADIKTGFLRISLADLDQKYLKFLWRANDDRRGFIAYRYSRVAFIVICSPFLLNATIKRYPKKSHFWFWTRSYSPGSPWWGGWLERLVRMLKEILRRLLENLRSGLKMCISNNYLFLLVVKRKDNLHIPIIEVVFMMTPENRSLWSLGVVSELMEAKTVYVGLLKTQDEEYKHLVKCLYTIEVILLI